jgi:DNA-binding winged helix-turn-helix (wHTH) protein/Tfp pilus assembly protein PilF
VSERSGTEKVRRINVLAMVGEWRVDFSTGEMTGPSGAVRLEPKVSQLLRELAGRAGRVVSREELMAAIWPDVIVGDDSLARLVSKLRRALGDDAREPRYIETMSKRGYRLLAPVDRIETADRADSQRARGWRWFALTAAVVLLVLAAVLGGLLYGPQRDEPQVDTVESDRILALLARAEDSYFQFSRADNEAAIELYERVLGIDPDDPIALAGLANALAQRSFRWPYPAGSGGEEFTTLGDALAAGHLEHEPALSQLERAERLARRAVEVAPESAATHKALGLVVSAQGDFDSALSAYRQALALDPEAWGPMINIGDILQIEGRQDEALPYFERAFEAMGRAYESDAVRVRPWHAGMGVLIAERYRDRGDLTAAEGWYRRVLAYSPLHPAATRGLAGVLREGGDAQAADRLCAELAERLGPEEACR